MLWFFFFFKQKTAYEMRISDWSSDVCSSDLVEPATGGNLSRRRRGHAVAQIVRGFEIAARRRIKLGDVGRALGAGELRAKADVGDRRILDAAAPAEHGADPVDIIIGDARRRIDAERSEEHTSELQSLMRISYAVFCLKKKT